MGPFVKEQVKFALFHGVELKITNNQNCQCN